LNRLRFVTQDPTRTSVVLSTTERELTPVSSVVLV
jgi:hypothetical protein